MAYDGAFSAYKTVKSFFTGTVANIYLFVYGLLEKGPRKRG